MADLIGTGTTISFGTSTFNGEILSVKAKGESRGVVQTSKMSTTGYHTKLPKLLVDGGSVDVELAFDPTAAANLPPITADPETITITFPKSSDSVTTQASVAFTGFVSAWDWGAPFEDKLTGSMTIEVADDPQWTHES